MPRSSSSIRIGVAGLLFCASLATGPLLATAAEPPGKTEFQVEPGVRQLFLDDNPEQTIQTRTAPVWDPASKLFKFWVLGIDDKSWQSADGLHWAPGPKTNLRTDMVVYDPLDADPSRRFKAALLNEGFAVSARLRRLRSDANPASVGTCSAKR